LSAKTQLLIVMVPMEGVEPTHSREYQILSLARLPIPPHRPKSHRTYPPAPAKRKRGDLADGAGWLPFSPIRPCAKRLRKLWWPQADYWLLAGSNHGGQDKLENSGTI
jgi:hypothetical protein